MRIMSYNILEGGQGREGAKDRLDLLASVVEDICPDILGLAEANGFLEEGARRFFKMEKMLGMRGFVAASRTGFNTAVFVRHPWEFVTARPMLEDLYHGALKAHVSRSGEAAWTVGVCHLNPFSPDARRIETAHLVAQVRAKPRTLLMGDFNSPSALDVEKGIVNRQTMEELPARYRLRYGWFDPDGSALANIERAGFVDVFRRLEAQDPGCTVPTEIGHGKKEGGMRLDYIFATDDVAKKAKTCQVLRNSRTQKASDHYPLVLELS